MLVSAIVFDLDNTLVECTKYFAEARTRLYRMILPLRPDLSREEFERVFRKIDTKNMRSPLGFGRDRFPTSTQEAYRVLCEEVGYTPTPSELEAAWAIGESVFEAPYKPYPGAIATLEWCRSQGLRLGLCTKGDPEVQRQKIERHGLERFFDHIAIVPQKHASEIGRTVDALGLPRREAVMVGDSLREDIDGGKMAGLATVWVKGDATDFHELYPDTDHAHPDAVIERISELAHTIATRWPLRQRRGRIPFAV